MKKPKVLIFDIETRPILAYAWGIWDQNIGLNQIKADWGVISWAAKWLGDPPSKVLYQDQSKARRIEDDKRILKGIWDLLNEADVVITQNGKAFDSKKLNARFVMNGMPPPSPYKHIDTLKLAKKYFAFTSNKLEFMSDKLCTKYKKLKHPEFGGFDLWKECLAGNKRAWAEMKKYNIHDVLALEELYTKLQPWDSSVNFNLYRPSLDEGCNCGSSQVERRGFAYTSSGKFQQFRCRDCGAWTRAKQNLLLKEKKDALRKS